MLEELGTRVALHYDQCADRVEEAMAVFTGNPVSTFRVADFKTDIDRADSKEERLDKLYETLNEAIRYGWFICANTAPIPKELDAKLDPINRRFATIKNMGIKYAHSYTILAMRKVEMKNGYNDILLLLRNPWGKD